MAGGPHVLTAFVPMAFVPLAQLENVELPPMDIELDGFGFG